MARFGSVITAMVTPFTADGELDYEGAAELARWLVAQGNDALVLSGTTGEAACLTDEEQIALWRAVRAAVNVPLIAGSGTNDTRHAAELTSAAAGAGMDAVLIVTPYYNRPSQAGIEAHFHYVCAATELPAIMYDIPVRTGRKIGTDLIVRMAKEIPNVVGLKDAAGDPGATSRVIAEAPEGFEVFSGDDSLTLPLLAVGAVGVIGVATHWAAPVMTQMISAFQSGDIVRAQQLNERMIESYEFETGDLNPNPVPTKAMILKNAHLKCIAGCTRESRRNEAQIEVEGKKTRHVGEGAGCARFTGNACIGHLPRRSG